MFTGMLNSLKTMFTEVKPDKKTGSNKDNNSPTPTKPLMSEAEELKLESIEKTVDEILSKVNQMPEKKQIVKELKFATNKYMSTAE